MRDNVDPGYFNLDHGRSKMQHKKDKKHEQLSDHSKDKYNYLYISLNIFKNVWK